MQIWHCDELWCRFQMQSDPALLWLCCRPADTAPIRPLMWEIPYVMGMALKFLCILFYFVPPTTQAVTTLLFLSIIYIFRSVCKYALSGPRLYGIPVPGIRSESQLWQHWILLTHCARRVIGPVSW